MKIQIKKIKCECPNEFISFGCSGTFKEDSKAMYQGVVVCQNCFRKLSKRKIKLK